MCTSESAASARRMRTAYRLKRYCQTAYRYRGRYRHHDAMCFGFFIECVTDFSHMKLVGR